MTKRAGSIIFAGGGTGGHIFPALAIAQSVAATPGCESVRRSVVASDKPLDLELLEAAGARGEVESVVSIPARPFSVRPRAAIRLARSWGMCVRETRMHIRDERDRAGGPVVLVAMGGYVSAPAVRAAISERCPVVLVNLDAVPGIANRWIANRADLRLVVGHETDQFEPLESEAITPIVRSEIHARPQQQTARRSFGFEPESPVLLVTGGSQGARTINEFLLAFAESHASMIREQHWQILHQAGGDQTDHVRAAYARLGIRAEVRPFLDNIASAWAAASATVCRAGAGTVAEVWATHTPALFLPYPFHKDQHQRINATVITEYGGSELGTDYIEAGRNLEENGSVLASILSDSARRLEYVDMLRRLGPADGANQVARSVAALLA